MDNQSHRPLASAVLMIAAAIGWTLCFVAYYPGLMSNDSFSMYREATTLHFSDVRPMMALIWAALEKLAPGPQTMLAFLLILYWGGFFVLSLAAVHKSVISGFAMIALAFMPFTINFAGTLWVDVLLATCWLLAAGLTFFTRLRRSTSVRSASAIFLFFLVGALARPNSIFAAIPLAIYLANPVGLWPKLSIAVLIAPGIIIVTWFLTNPILHAERTYPINAILTYDLGGISHYTGSNQFPITVSSDEAQTIVHDCYTPDRWDPYRWGRCSFVYDRLAEGGVWGSSKLWRTWFGAIISHPTAYVHHRTSHFRHFIGVATYTFHSGQDAAEAARRTSDHPGFGELRRYIEASSGLWMFQPGFWLVLAVGCLLWARRLTDEPERFVAALSASSILYILTYAVVGVSSDFRYAYWSVLATSAAFVVCATEVFMAGSSYTPRGRTKFPARNGDFS